MYGSMFKRRSYNVRSRRGGRPSMHTRTKKNRYGVPRSGNVWSGKNLQLVPFQRWTDESDDQLVPVPGNNVEKSIGGSFQIDEIKALSEFSTMFDLYRIKYVEVIYTPSFNVNDWPTTGGGNVRPFLWVSFDPDDALAATSSAIKERGDCKLYDAFRRHRWIVKPKPLTRLVSAGGTTFRGGPYNGWIDMADTNVPHYGLKILVQIVSTAASTSVVPFTWSVQKRYHFDCKGIR